MTDSLGDWWFQRDEPERGRVGALNELHILLVGHAQRYASGELEQKRQAIVETLQDVQNFLSSQGFTLTTTAPLNHVLETLVDCQRGSKADPIFLPRRRPEGGAPKLSLQRMIGDGVLAALAELWLKAHATEEGKQKDKLSAACRAMRGRWFRNITASRLKQALEDARGEASDHPTRWRYLDLMEHWGAPGIDPKDAFKGLVATCNAPGSEAHYGET